MEVILEGAEVFDDQVARGDVDTYAHLQNVHLAKSHNKMINSYLRALGGLLGTPSDFFQKNRVSVFSVTFLKFYVQLGLSAFKLITIPGGARLPHQRAR